MNRREFVVSGDVELVAVVDRPESSAARRVALVCHGLTGEKAGPGGLLRELGESLAGDGWHTYRWDLPGGGDSGDDLETVSYGLLVDSVVRMARTAVADLHGPPDELALIGHSFGSIIMLSASRLLAPQHLIVMASDLTPGSELVVPADGSIRGGAYRMSDQFWHERCAVDPLAVLDESEASRSIVAGALDQSAVAALNKVQRFRTAIIPEANHLFTGIEPRRLLLDEVRGFLR